MYTVSLYQIPPHVKNPFERKAGAHKIRMESNSGPRIYMKNFLSQKSFKGTTHNTVCKSNTYYSVKEAISRTGILSTLTMPQL